MILAGTGDDSDDAEEFLVEEKPKDQLDLIAEASANTTQADVSNLFSISLFSDESIVILISIDGGVGNHWRRGTWWSSPADFVNAEGVDGATTAAEGSRNSECGILIK